MDTPPNRLDTPYLAVLRDQGQSFKEIGAAVGLSASAVRDRLARSGYVDPYRNPHPRGRRTSTDRIVRLWNEGLTHREIGQLVGMSARGVGARLVQAAIDIEHSPRPRPGQPRRGVSTRRIEELLRQGKSYGAIAQEVGMSKSGVRARLRREGKLP